MHAYYGLSLPRKLWVMGYKGFMGYVGDFPASQLGRWDFLWVMGGYGLREVWVIRVSTVSPYGCTQITVGPQRAAEDVAEAISERLGKSGFERRLSPDQVS